MNEAVETARVTVSEALEKFKPEGHFEPMDIQFLATCLQTVELRLSIVEKELRALQDEIRNSPV